MSEEERRKALATCHFLFGLSIVAFGSSVLAESFIPAIACQIVAYTALWQAGYLKREQ
jgi:hypothetical protein